jgi:hypothetical protein
MSRSILIALSVIILGCDSGTDPAYFEGAVAVKIEVESKTERLPEELLLFWHGSRENRLYKNGNIRYDSVDGTTASIWYKRAENTEYALRTCDEYIRIVDFGDSDMNLVAIERPQESREIAGYRARAIELHFGEEDGSVTVWRFWYAPDLLVNPEWYKDYRHSGLDILYQHIDSLVIGFESESLYTNMRKFATSVQRRPVPDSAFDMPDLEVRRLSLDEALEVGYCLPDEWS